MKLFLVVEQAKPTLAFLFLPLRKDQARAALGNNGDQQEDNNTDAEDSEHSTREPQRIEILFDHVHPFTSSAVQIVPQTKQC